MAKIDSPQGSPQGSAADTAPETPASPPVVVKKYANRRLYNTETSSYVTLEDLAAMVRLGRHFTVSDAKSGDDITRSVLTQIIVEEESKGQNLLPIPFLRQLIGLYGDSLQSVVPRYLEATMGTFARQQEAMRRTAQEAMGSAMGGTMGSFNAFAPFEELGKQNLAMLERAMSLFSPFPPRAGGAAPTGPMDEVEAMREELATLREEVERLRAGRSMG
ncbi:polyhydroxyalkanoate synthesis repressor PhaR [Roseomonas indoligenes]|uniref:Polyhydroxyalkanoate synthesis repressor PhaR n=1 Tax=Roseomonas indoligenes TaxID=2820811 RepID=A0A940S7V8_9PROT|nr:polyhydroxyalkanoate synthesis repressor PhaR [Pararoseomonas indoligenes]MBP0495310.1 polyhydroxyalkanoate synthesis repressor PhaR [Pararoseomonas indoligenes]